MPVSKPEFINCSQRRHFLPTVLAVIAFTLFAGSNPIGAQELLALVGGRLVDGNGGVPIEDAAIVINGSIITAVGPVSTTQIPAGAKIVRVVGKTILPGLIDAHMHIGGSGGGSADSREFTPAATHNNLLSYLKFGVTTVYDMAALPNLNEMKTALDAGHLVGPRLYGNGFGITAPGSHPIRLLTEIGVIEILGPFYFQVDTVEAGRAAVRKIAAAKTDGIKIFHSRAESATSRYDSDRNKLKPEVLKAVIEEAHARGLKVYAHISFPSEAKEVVEAGGDVIVHSISMAETGADEVLKLMAARNVVYIPTLAVTEANYALNADLFFTSSLRGKVWDVLLDSITHPKSIVMFRQDTPGFINDTRRSLEISMANLRQAIKAGVKIALGSDAGNAGMLHGVTVIRELELMNRAGMTPMQVIIAATKNAAEVIGQGQRLGTLEPGKLADIIVVDGNPLQDISVMRKLEWVVKNGKIIDPGKLAYEEPPLSSVL